MRDTVGENREEQETHGLILAHFKAFSPEKKKYKHSHYGNKIKLKAERRQ